jgi:SAM-dependent methyltransferase
LRNRYGQAAGKLALLFDRVDACDINHSQLEAAERSANVFYLECPVEQAPYGDAVFDLITVAQSLHWFDFPRFWPQVERTLKPGGVFAAWGYDWFQVSPEVDDAMRFFRAVIEPFWSSCSQLLWDGYRTSACLCPHWMYRATRYPCSGIWNSCWAISIPGLPPNCVCKAWAIMCLTMRGSVWHVLGQTLPPCVRCSCPAFHCRAQACLSWQALPAS